MARPVTGLLVVLLGAGLGAVQRDAATAVLQNIVDRIVSRYEQEEQQRRVCGVEIISTPEHLLFRSGSEVPSLDMEAPVCCSGYERNATTLKCGPRCRSGCPNGRCVAPDMCVCLARFARTMAGDCVPTCPTSCLNGRCYGDRCVCNPGFSRRSAICAPQCQGVCSGGNCTAPNTCVCTKAGYLVNEEGDCEPFCQGGCMNAKCTSPNKCTCWNGYKKHSGQGSSPNTCVPDCFNKCVHGYCTGPGKCTCQPGYTLSQQHKFTCRPDCQPRCINGTCTEPGICTCNLGHVKRNNDWVSHVCVTTHAAGGGACNNCTNGVCSSGRCLCYDGYYKDQATNLCVPRCSKPCLHGHCSGPNTCSCEPGYNFDFYRKECVLSCSPPCQHGSCADGNICRCNPGYASDSTDWTGRRCLPLCDPFCINGVCSSPNQCICNAGFVKDRSSGHDHICVPGYGRSSNTMTTWSYG